MITTPEEHRRLEQRYITPVEKAERVVDSCETLDQLRTARRYVDHIKCPDDVQQLKMRLYDKRSDVLLGGEQ